MSKPDNMPARTTDKDGRDVYVYPDGAVKDAKTGFWIQPAPKNKITVLTSPLLMRRRKELNQQAAEEGVIQALRENKNYHAVNNSQDATRALAKIVTKIALNSIHDRDRIDAAEKAIKFADLLQRDNAIENTTNILNVDPETAKSIIRLIQQLQGETITTEFKELPNGRKWV